MKSVFAILLACQTGFCATSFLTGQAARLVVGQQNFTYQLYQSPPTQNVLAAPAGVAYGGDRLFVVDSNVMFSALSNNRVLEYTPVSAFPTPTSIPSQSSSLYGTCPVCVGVPSLVLGQPDFVTNTVATTQSSVYAPTAVATDGTILAVADTNNNRVLIWRSIPTTNNQPADVVVGQADFTTSAAPEPPTASSLSGPQGVWIYNGQLFIADTFNNRVLIYHSIPTSNGASADVVLGQPDFVTNPPPPVTEDVPPPTQSSLASPTSVTTEGTHLFIADLGHNRVLIWNSIPASNGAPADVVLGQPDFVSDLSDNSSVLCPSNGTDSTTGDPTYPFLCGNTYSFPRFALSDGVRLFVADGGNDRVLVYNTIPTANPTPSTAGPDAILGQPDQNTDSASADTDSLQTPSALAWDGTNLWVADAYNLRVVAYTPVDFDVSGQLPVTAVRNAASLQIYGTGTITFAGTPAEKDTLEVTIDTTNYTYTVQKNDTLLNIATGLANLINGLVSGTAQDTNVDAIADLSNVVNPRIILTARLPGSAGTGTAYSATVTSASVTATTAAPTIEINLADATQIGPGSLITIYGSNLSSQTAAASIITNSDGTQVYPIGLGGTKVYVDGMAAHLLYVSPTQINAQMPFEVDDRTSVSVEVVSHNADGSVSASNAIGTVIVAANPGIFAASGPEPRAGFVYHYSQNAIGVVDVDGTINAGDTGTITINGTAYTYTVQSTDTLDTIETALINLINATDPNVTASAANEFNRIILTAKKAGTAGAAITLAASDSSGADLILTALSTTLCCGTSATGLVTPDNPAIPGEPLVVYATGLGITTSPADSSDGKIVTNGSNSLVVPVDSILAGSTSATIISANLLPGTAGVYEVLFQLPTTLPTENLTSLTIAQGIHVSNIVTFAVQAPATTTSSIKTALKRAR